jgi:hypothetical protein
LVRLASIDGDRLADLFCDIVGGHFANSFWAGLAGLFAHVLMAVRLRLRLAAIASPTAAPAAAAATSGFTLALLGGSVRRGRLAFLGFGF